MSDPEANASPAISINVPQKLFGGVWANYATVSHSEHEFTIDFIRIDPSQQQGIVTSRVNVSPLFVTQLQEALRINWEQYAQKSMPPELQGGDAQA